MAIIAPVFLLLIFGIVEFGLWMYARNVVTLSAREGASYLRVSGAIGDPAGWQDAAEQTALEYANQVGLMTDVTATATSDDQQATVEVCGRYAHPMGILIDAPVCQSITVEIEQFEPDTGEQQ